MPVAQSSHLQEYDYDANSQTLTVQFQNGAVYQYTGVPMDKAEKLRRSGGSGTVFHAEIRGQYGATKIADPGSDKKR